MPLHLASMGTGRKGEGIGVNCLGKGGLASSRTPGVELGDEGRRDPDWPLWVSLARSLPHVPPPTHTHWVPGVRVAVGSK